MATERSWWMTIIDTVLLLYSSIVTSGLPIIFWVKPRWSIEQMPNQQGRVSDVILSLRIVHLT